MASDINTNYNCLKTSNILFAQAQNAGAPAMTGIQKKTQAGSDLIKFNFDGAAPKDVDRNGRETVIGGRKCIVFTVKGARRGINTKEEYAVNLPNIEKITIKQSGNNLEITFIPLSDIELIQEKTGLKTYGSNYFIIETSGNKIEQWAPVIGMTDKENNDETSKIEKYFRIYINEKDEKTRYLAEEQLKQMVHSNISMESKEFLYNLAIKTFSEGQFTGGIIEEFTKADVPQKLRERLFDFSIRNVSHKNGYIRWICSQYLLDFVIFGISKESKMKLLNVALYEIKYNYGDAAMINLHDVMDKIIDSDKSIEFQEKAINTIIPYLKDENPITRKCATSLLGRYAGQNISLKTRMLMVGLLIKNLSDQYPSVVSETIWALGLLVKTDISMESKNKIANELVDILKISETYKGWKDGIRSDASWALGQLSDQNINQELRSKIKEALNSFLYSDIPLVRSRAKEALQKFN